MRVACLLVTHLRAKVEMYRHSHLEDATVVIVDRSPSRAGPWSSTAFGQLQE